MHLGNWKLGNSKFTRKDESGNSLECYGGEGDSIGRREPEPIHIKKANKGQKKRKRKRVNPWRGKST